LPATKENESVVGYSVKPSRPQGLVVCCFKSYKCQYSGSRTIFYHW